MTPKSNQNGDKGRPNLKEKRQRNLEQVRRNSLPKASLGGTPWPPGNPPPPWPGAGILPQAIEIDKKSAQARTRRFFVALVYVGSDP